MARRAHIGLAVVGLLIVAVAVLGLAASRLDSSPERDAQGLIAALNLRPGLTVADIGAGDGKVSIRVARAVAPSGRVYATEIDAGALATLRRTAAPNMTVIEGGERTTGLPASCCDVVYMRRVYHHLSAAAAMNRSFYEAVRPGGRLVILEGSQPWWWPSRQHAIRADRVEREVTSAGFVVERRIRDWSPFYYCLVFRKPG